MEEEEEEEAGVKRKNTGKEEGWKGREGGREPQGGWTGDIQ